MPQTHDTIQDNPLMAKGTISTAYVSTGNYTKGSRLVFKNNMILSYDDQNRVSSVYGYIPALATYPVFIVAQYGYDVFIDILGLPTVT